MLNPLDPQHVQRLFDAMKHSERMYEPFLRDRKKMLDVYVGSHYGESRDDQREIIVNYMRLAAEALSMELAANRPRVLATTDHADLYAFSKVYQVRMNRVLEEIALENTLQACVLDAFFGMGISKVAMIDSGYTVDAGDRYIDPGRSYAHRVSPDHWLHDMQAHDWRLIRFARDTYRVTQESMLQDERFDKRVSSLIKPATKFPGTKEALRGSDLQRGGQTDADDTEPMVDLMDVWLPAERLWCVWAVDQPTKPLYVEEYDGPVAGPYKRLGFLDVPDNTMPASPAQNFKSLHDLVNAIARKLANQARRQKTLMTYSDAQDAERMRLEKDGGMVKAQNPEAVQERRMGGVDGANYTYYQGLVGELNKHAGNVEAMLGLGTQADTLGQDRLLHSSASAHIANMQKRVLAFTREIVEHLGYLEWNDGFASSPGKYYEEGISYPFDADWSPELRMGEFPHYKLDVEPYSMAYRSPADRLQGIVNFINGVLPNLAQSMAQQGGQIDVKEVIATAAELMDEPRLKRIITFGEPYPTEPGDDAQKPASTHRTYTQQRVSTGGTPDGQRNQLAAQMQRVAP